MTSPLTAALADRYRIERELGQGGMATVYLAHDLKHDHQVAESPSRPIAQFLFYVMPLTPDCSIGSPGRGVS